MKNPFRIFKKLNPVTPIKKGIESVENTLIKQLILMVLRHGLSAAGLAGALSGDDMQQLVGGAMMLGGLAWSAARKIRTARDVAAATKGGQ